MCKLLQNVIYKVQRLTVCAKNEDSIAFHPLPSPQEKKPIHFRQKPSLFYRLLPNFITLHIIIAPPIVRDFIHS
jgi:hypothetical protein